MDVMNGTSTREDVLQALELSKSTFDNEQVEDISNQGIYWAWDITDSGNKDTLVSELDKYFGQ